MYSRQISVRSRFTVLASILVLAFLLPRPAAAIGCVWEPVIVSIERGRELVLRVADQQGAEKILKICSINTDTPGVTRPDVCSTYYTSALGALAIGAELRISFNETVLDGIGWNGTCQSIAGQSNVDEAIWEFAVIAPE